jgi:hypothetical protein
MSIHNRLPAVTADEWIETEQIKGKLGLKRVSDGQKALFKPPGGDGPQHVTELVASRLAQALGLNAHDVQLFDHETIGWGALAHELPRGYQDLQDLPGMNDIVSGADRTTLANDDNIRAMPIFDAVIGNDDRHGKNSMVTLDVSRDAFPRRYRHWLVDHANGFWGEIGGPDLVRSSEPYGGIHRYIEENRNRLESALEYAYHRWWDAVDPFVRRLAQFPMSDLEAILGQVPGGLLPAIHLDGMKSLVRQARETSERFIAGKVKDN